MKYVILSLLISQSAFAFLPKKVQKKMFINSPIKRVKGGGAMDGGGSGANFPESGAAWFYQDNPKGYISVCIKRDQAFKATYSEIENVIKKSFKKWDDYIKKANFYERLDDDGVPLPEPYPTHMKILTQVKIESQCTTKTDITFYFGFVDKKVQSILDNMVSPKAFAYRNYSDIDSSKGTSKGIIYIFSPKPLSNDDGSLDLSDISTYDWSKKNRLLAITMHEVGHVMGVPHIPNTIMEEDVGNIIKRAHGHYQNPEDTKRYQDYLEHIDHDSRVIITTKDFAFFKGTLGVTGSVDEKSTYKFFTKKNLIGKSQVEMRATPNLEYFNMVIKDDKNSTEFKKLKFDINSSTFSLGNLEVFKRVRKESHEWGFFHETDFETNAQAILHTQLEINNEKISFDLSLNFGINSFKNGRYSYLIQSPFTMHYYNPKTQKRTLFLAEKIWEMDISDEDTYDDINDVEFPGLLLVK